MKSHGEPKKIFSIYSTACLRTRTYAQQVYNYLIKNGFCYDKIFRKAGLIIIDTCAFSQERQNRSMSVIQYLIKHRRKNAKIIIIGCLPAIDPSAISGIKNIYSVSSNELEKLDKIINAEIKFRSIPSVVAVKSFVPPLLNMAEPKTKYGNFSPIEYHVNIGKGCLGNCSYCSIKFVWGRMQSRALDDIINDFRVCLSKGAKIISLETQDLGAYGIDINTTVVELMQKLFEHEGNYKIVLHDLNANWLIEYYLGLERTFVNNADKIYFINIPVQSGSNRILRLMRRPYTIEEAKKSIFSLKKKLPNTLIWTDIMVGFPGETEKDFEETKRFMEEFKMIGGYFWLTAYSERKNTESSKMSDKVPFATIKLRVFELQMLFSKFITTNAPVKGISFFT